MSNEQRVRTMAGWIGVEISRSRVRTAGKAGYGLYRVRGSVAHRTPAELAGLIWGAVTTDGLAERGPWTAYAFTLEAIRLAVEHAITKGTPVGPRELHVLAPHATASVVVTTRWTSAYAGRRDLGERVLLAPGLVDPATYDKLGGAMVDQLNGGPTVPMTTGQAEAMVVPAQVTGEYARQVNALSELLDAGLIRMQHVEGCVCDGATGRMDASCVRATMPDRMRQRADEAAFQAEHLRRREYGLTQRYAAKRARQGNGRQAQE